MWLQGNFPSAKPAIYKEIQTFYSSPRFGTTRCLAELDRIKSIIEGSLSHRDRNLVLRRSLQLQWPIPRSRVPQQHLQLPVFDTP